MRCLETVEHMRDLVRTLRAQNLRIGLVPTMGYLHEGHLSLVRIAQQSANVCLASIFVNPTQFNNATDLQTYPRDVERDLALLESVGCYAAFVPTAADLYQEGFDSWVSVTKLAADLEGAHRPGHFQGVATVVSILFHVVEPDVAIFGEKDFQQLRIIEQMVRDLKFNVQVVRAPVVREADGLAMSSRNVRIPPHERPKALALSRGLFRALQAFQQGERSSAALERIVLSSLEEFPAIAVDYVRVVSEETLLPQRTLTDSSRILVAASVAGVRLIDNIALTVCA